MRTLIKLFSVSFLISSVLYVFSSVAMAATREGGQQLTFLVVGFDESPANTDVISVISYDGGANTVRAIQIPRDTLVNYGNKNGKVNGFYSYEINRGQTNEQALASLTDKVSRLLGIDIDGYAALTSEGFIDFVDYVGGVNIESSKLPKPLADSIGVKEGSVHLDGKSAFEFVRYRKDYQRGDLERLDAQKIFAKALFFAIKERREYFSLFKFISQSDGITFEMNKGRSFSFILQNIFKTSSADFQMATLPGEAEKSDGVWYYIIKREEAEALIFGYFPYSDRGFDLDNDFIYSL